jgi:hypothetical protein
MRKRAAIVLASSVPVWLFLAWFDHVAREAPWGYGIGSVALPPPAWFGFSGLVARLSLLIGSYLLIADFVRWRIKGSDAAAR